MNPDLNLSLYWCKFFILFATIFIEQNVLNILQNRIKLVYWQRFCQFHKMASSVFEETFTFIRT